MKPLPATFLALLITAGYLPALSGQPKPAEPKSATEWFRRADDRTNLRLPGSSPFHMKVVFQAFPGEDFSTPGQSPILTGEGVYEETWLSPDTWRRAVTFGSYHAVESRVDGVRKFQAGSDYEPSRVLMLLNALLDLIPRNLLSPEIEMAKPHWKVQRVRSGSAPVVRLRYNRNSLYIPASSTWDFSPDGQPLRASSAGLIVTWQDAHPFAGKWFPAAISAASKDRTLLSATVTLGPADTIDHATLRLPGATADPAATLRPLRYYDVIPASILPSNLSVLSLVETAITGRAVIDRHGVPHEVEALGPAHRSIGADWIATIRKERFTPATIDGAPCEFAARFLPPNPDSSDFVFGPLYSTNRAFTDAS
jgi:hypothetical protein